MYHLLDFKQHFIPKNMVNMYFSLVVDSIF